MLALGVVLVLGLVLFNSLVSVNINGWSSGFTHPLHGGDHFLTMLAVGIWAAQLRGKAIWLLPLTFVGVMSLGGLAGAAGLFIPSAELIILLSGLVFSVFIVRKIRFSSQINVIIVAFFAFFHGFAHGQEISTSASLISYTLGFMVATLLLHGAGILIVRLLVVIFALFISQLALAQSFVSHSAVKLTGHTQTINSDELHTVAAPDSHYYQQLLDSGKNGGHNSVGWVEPSKTHHNQSAIRWISPCFTHPTNGGCEFIRAIYQASNNVAYTVAAHWLLSPQISIHFLTNGVGDTAPPIASISHYTPPAIPAYHEYLVLIPPRTFDLPHYNTLATRFLTNGVGATSPPVLSIAAVVSSLDSNECVFHNSTRFKSSTARQSSVSRPLCFRNSVIANTRFKSRSPPFAFFSALTIT
ncbi:MAG: HupE/UreJ family protein [Methylococcales bacterium]|nr:HupE/UreJ family protein [Methylococcales bacterium]